MLTAGIIMVRVHLGRRERFYIAFVATLFLGILWPFALWWQVKGQSSAWWPWFKNDLVHSLFHIVLLPPVVGLIAATSLATPLRSMGLAARRLSLVVLAILLAMAFDPVYDNMHALPLAPLSLDTPAHRREAYDLDRCLRRWLSGATGSRPCAEAADAKLRELLASRGDTVLGAQRALTRADARSEAAFQVYAASTAPWYDATRPSMRTTAHWVTFILSFGGVIVAIVIIWLLGVLAYQRRAIDSHTKERVVLAFLLFVLYLPLAVYVDWYQHYFLFSHLKESSVKIAAFLLAVVAFVLVLVVIGDPKKVLPWVAGLAALGVFGALKDPAVLIDVADAVDLMAPSLVIGLITLLSLFVVILADIYVRERQEAPDNP